MRNSPCMARTCSAAVSTFIPTAVTKSGRWLLPRRTGRAARALAKRVFATPTTGIALPSASKRCAPSPGSPHLTAVGNGRRSHAGTLQRFLGAGGRGALSLSSPRIYDGIRENRGFGYLIHLSLSEFNGPEARHHGGGLALPTWGRTNC